MANERAQGTAVFPAGMTLRLEADGAVVGNQGDLVIEGDISKNLGNVKQVFSEQGSVEISAPAFKADRIDAAGDEVVLKGNVNARKITGAAVRATGGKVTSQVIIADREVELSGKSIKVELVVAPKVAFGAETKGRATAVECDNEIGASKVRGRLFRSPKTSDTTGIAPSRNAAGHAWCPCRWLMSGSNGTAVSTARRYSFKATSTTC